MRGTSDDPFELDGESATPAKRPSRRVGPPPAKSHQIALWFRLSTGARIGAVAGIAFLLLVIACGTGWGIRSFINSRHEASEGSGASTRTATDSVAVEVQDAMILENEALLIYVTVTTSDARKRVDFTGWRRGGLGSAAMTDDAGNRYSQKSST